MLLGDRRQNLFGDGHLKPPAKLAHIVIGSGIEDETILKAIVFGAKGYVDASASPADFVRAIRSSAKARFGLRAAFHVH